MEWGMSQYTDECYDYSIQFFLIGESKGAHVKPEVGCRDSAVFFTRVNAVAKAAMYCSVGACKTLVSAAVGKKPALAGSIRSMWVLWHRICNFTLNSMRQPRS